MKIALDRKADECIGDNLIQLRTPLTGYARKDGVPWGNGQRCIYGL